MRRHQGAEIDDLSLVDVDAGGEREADTSMHVIGSLRRDTLGPTKLEVSTFWAVLDSFFILLEYEIKYYEVFTEFHKALAQLE
jgi:hypothetical protein